MNSFPQKINNLVADLTYFLLSLNISCSAPLIAAERYLFFMSQARVHPGALLENLQGAGPLGRVHRQ